MMRSLTVCLLALWLLLPAAVARQSAPPKVNAPALLGKPAASVEKALGKTRHVDGRERYYKVDGFVRIVATLAPDGSVAHLVFQFPHGVVGSEAEARAKVGLGEPLPKDVVVSWSVDPSHDDLSVAAPPPSPTESYILTRHFKERMRERGVSEATALDVLRNGQRFYDPKYDNEVRWKDGVYIAVGRDGALITVIRGPINRHWRPK